MEEPVDHDEATLPPPTAPAPLRPVGERDRILALDVLRGFALFGIFWVNIVLHGRPFIDAIGPIGGDAAFPGEIAAWAIIKIFFEFKFISLFSLLFGMGMAVQLVRADAAGRPFVALYLRRLAVLALFGLAHALALWYGDILFFYACCGVLLLAMARLRARTLLIVAVVLFLGTAVVGMGLGALGVAMQRAAQVEEIEQAAAAEEEARPAAAGEGAAAEATDEDVAAAGATGEDGAAEDAAGDGADDDDPPAQAEAFRARPFATAWQVILAEQGNLIGEGWAELERLAYGQGPFVCAFALRAYTFAFVALQLLFTYAWRIVAVFLAGAALMKMDFFDPRRRAWHRRLCAVGLGVGLPIECAATWLVHVNDLGTSFGWLFGEMLHYFGSMLLCLGYVGAIVIVVQRGLAARVAGMLAAVGRLALSNYILQTVAATAVMYWWGLGRFDTFGRPQLIGIVLAVFAGQLVLSAAWLKVARMGPLEWLWRSLTYGRLEPILRARGGEARP